MNDYYDLDTNRIFVNGLKDLMNKNTDSVIYKKLYYGTVLENLYIINQYGVVVNLASNRPLSYVMDEQGYPCVVLSMRKGDRIIADSFRIVDLVACSFIRNSEYYLERGYIASYKNRNVTDNYYDNIEYKEPKLCGGMG